MIKVAKIGLTIVAFVKGQMLQKVCNNLEEVINTYEKVINATSEDEVEVLLKPQKTQVEIQFEEKINAQNKELLQTKELAKSVLDTEYKGKKIFESKDSAIYMKGINLSIPKFLAESISKADEKELGALINFWKLCALNPDPRARQDLFDFLKGGKFTITPLGYFIAYRNVNIKSNGKNSKLATFVSTSYLKVKGWKKSPVNFGIGKQANGEYILLKKNKTVSTTSYEYVGNLNTLYKTPAVNDVVYTDARTGTFNIKIGELVKMVRKDCNSNPNEDCSYGLHVGNKSFLNKGGFGRVGIAVLINPSKVVAVPKYNQNKMRVCEYLPIGVIEYDSKGQIIEVETSLFESNYCDYDIKQINDMIKKHGYSFEELKKNELIPYEIDHKTLTNIKLNMTEVNTLVKNRVVKV